MLVFCVSALAACITLAGTVLFDFETEAERTAVPAGDRWGYSVSVTNRYAASGDWAVRFECPPWRKGVADWPSCEFRPAVTNWTGYDRLVVEVVSLRDAPPDANGDGGGSLMLCLAGPTGPVKRGLEVHLKTPTRGYHQWVVPLKWPKPRKGMASLAENVARVHFFTVAKSHKEGHEFYIDRLVLLKKGEPIPAPSGPCVGRDILPLEIAAKTVQSVSNATLRAEMAHREDYERFCRDALLSPYCSPDMALGWATSMEKIMPRGRFTARPIPTEGLRVRLAGNEYESVQLLVSPLGRDLKNMRVKVDGVEEFSVTNITISPVGYVNITNPAPYRVGQTVPCDKASGFRRVTRKADLGWHPDPILDGVLDGVDVSGTDVQSFWVRVHCPEGQTAGEYKGALVVSADGVAPVRVPFSVRVNGFAVPRASPLPLAITFCPDYALGTNSPAPRAVITGRLTEWCDFLADHYVTMDDIYMPGNGRNTIHFDMLERLRDQGRLGLFNLGHWNLPKSTNETDMAVWRKRWIEPLKKAYEEAKRRNLLGHAYSYGCDEVGIKSFPLVRAAAEEVRAAVPGVPLSTTSYDDDFGVGTNRLLDVIDWFTPSTMKFNPAKAALSRAEGHQVWWYICVGPQAPFANMFVECPAIEGRILMGAQTVRMRPDGFLYYFINLWPRTNRCIEGGPFTDWNPRSYGTTHGDGSWVCPGPGGRPLSTIRFENFRDGLEDYAYAKLLEEKLRMRGNGELGRGEWIRRAKAALAVPGEVVDERPRPAEGLNPEYWRNCPVMYSMTNFTGDPETLYRWRDEMADLIESFSAETEGHSPVFSIVETCAGPRLAVDGVAQPAVAALPDPFEKPVLPVNEVPAMRDFADAGVRLFSNVWSMRSRPHDWWKGEGVYDWETFDALALGLLATCPDGWIMPRVKIEPPKWWCEAHPGEMSASGEEVRADSVAWRALYRRMLRDVIAHAEASSYGTRIVGWHIGGLACGEWLDWNRSGAEIPSVPQRWMDDPLAPDKETAARREYVRKRAKDAADALLDAAALVKELTHGKLVCAFYGYGHAVEHGDMMRVVRSGLVDFFSAPAYYVKGARGVGDPGVVQAYCTSSYALHGRLFLEEADPRTHLAKISENEGMSETLKASRPANLAQTVGVLRRFVGKNLAQGTGLWWFLLAGNGTFQDASMMATVKTGLEEERRRISESRPRLTDVAVFTDADEYATCYDCHAPKLYEWKFALHTQVLPRTGVAYDSYELSDIADPNLPDYKVYVFPNAFSPTDAEREAMERLATAGKRIIRLEHPVAVEELRRLLAEAGAHVWLDTGDVVFAGRGYLTVHASSAGAKEIRLPAPCNVSEIFGAEPKRKGVVSFSTKMSFGQTLVYSLRPLMKQNVSKP